jgi:hypothetical protein
MASLYQERKLGDIVVLGEEVDVSKSPLIIQRCP